MVFTLNTTVFAEEVAVDSVEETVEATVDAVDSEVAEEATVDAVVDDADDAAAASDTYEDDGIYYTVEDDKPVTKITYASNGEKKNAVNNVATITNTTDPVSWNNAYATSLIETVLSGSEGNDEWLNNSSKVGVSSNNGAGNLAGQKGANDDWRYEVIKVADGQYIFVGYGVASKNNEDKVAANDDYKAAYVAGYDTLEPRYEKEIGGYKLAAALPVASWDGRTIEYNKGGKHSFTTAKKEALDVKMAFVTYSNGTVTEINGIKEGSVKVDKKNQKAASVAYDTNAFVYKVNNDSEDGKTIKATNLYANGNTVDAEHKTLSDLPFFTIKAKVGKDGKSYKKDITSALKDKKFYFGIMQEVVSVDDSDAIDDAIDAFKENAKDSISGDSISGDAIDKVEDALAETLVNNAQELNQDFDAIDVDYGYFTVTKFTDKGATLTRNGYVGDDKTGFKKTGLKAISGKGNNAEYSFADGSLANTTVKVLTFKDGGNYIYKPLDKRYDADGKETKVWDSTSDDLAPVGFKWAFRQTPDKDGKKQKTFRYGIYKTSNQGFVYSVEETAVDSVEEAF